MVHGGGDGAGAPADVRRRVPEEAPGAPGTGAAARERSGGDAPRRARATAEVAVCAGGGAPGAGTFFSFFSSGLGGVDIQPGPKVLTLHSGRHHLRGVAGGNLTHQDGEATGQDRGAEVEDGLPAVRGRGRRGAPRCGRGPSCRGRRPRCARRPRPPSGERFIAATTRRAARRAVERGRKRDVEPSPPEAATRGRHGYRRQASSLRRAAHAHASSAPPSAFLRRSALRQYGEPSPSPVVVGGGCPPSRLALAHAGAPGIGLHVVSHGALVRSGGARTASTSLVSHRQLAVSGRRDGSAVNAV